MEVNKKMKWIELKWNETSKINLGLNGDYDNITYIIRV